MEDGPLETKMVLITPQGMGLLEDRFEELFGTGWEIEFTNGLIPERERLRSLLADKDAVVLGSETIDDDILTSCPKLKIISRFGSGHDAICPDDIKKHNVALTIVDNLPASAVARHTLALFLSVTNNLIKQKYSAYAHVWDRTLNLSPELTTVGLIGMGPIARQFAGYLQGLGFSVRYWSRSRHLDAEEQGIVHDPTMEALIQNADVVSLHLKLVEGTKGIISQEIINKMAGKYFINTARGHLVDEEALFQALAIGKIPAAATDVYHEEPAKGLSHMLQSLPNVTATNHVAAYDRASILHVGTQAIQNILHFFENRD
jgi:D-3-phosphoglycerate dehydrogenase / 2-oxoglutarate reductase